MAKKYTVNSDGTITNSETVNIGTTSTDFSAAIAALGINGYDLAAIANLWAQGAPADLLAATYTTGTINQEAMINYAVARQFQQNYPTVTVGSDSWRGTISNYIFASPGNVGIDTAIYGVYGFSYYYYIMNGIPSNEIGIMQYATNTTSGLIAVIHMNDLRSTYGAVTSGTLSEIMFNNWLYNNYLKNSANLHYLYSVDMLKQVNEAAFKYLWFDSALGYGHGLDRSYISNLPNLGGSFDQSQSVVPVTNTQQMRQLGEEAFNHAWTGLGYTNVNDFIDDIRSGTVGVIGLPYYYNVMYNGQLTSLAGFLDGINYLNVFTIHNLMTASSHVEWNWDKLQALFLHVASVDMTNSSNTQISSNTITFIDGTLVDTPDGSLASWGGVKGMMLAWAQQEPYDYMMTLSRVGCRCSASDYYSALWAMSHYPLGPNENYIIMSLDGYSQQDSARTTIFGVSPSRSTYLTSGDTSDPNALFILIRWNSITNTGTAVLVDYDPAVARSIANGDGYSSANYNWFIDRALRNPGHLDPAFSAYREIPLTAHDLADLTSSWSAAAAGSPSNGDPVKFIQNFVIPEPSTHVSPTSNSNTSENGFNTVKTALTNAWNNLTAATSQAAANEIAPGLSSEQMNPTASTSTPTSTSPNFPLGAMVGIIVLSIAAILGYLGRNTIVATIRGSERLGK